MDFEEKVQSMTAKEIIMAMVKGLTIPPIININMDTYGEVMEKKYFFGLLTKKVCFGCAATNTVCQISGKIFDPSNISNDDTRAQFLNTDRIFLRTFEQAVNSLRKGSINGYNFFGDKIRIAKIYNPGNLDLPYLHSDYTNKDLEPYKRLAEMQD